ncbi:MAG TPA: NUDIX domain-containing protein [Verrucomicrobiae bacterium]|nr:NUDIX domain-containing protein [Verrucomicrobiae bacterium]
MTFKKLSSEELRKHKGVSFTGITTVFFCHDGQGKLLLGKRSKNARDEHGRWDPGGGGLKHGQSVEESMKREILEEYGTVSKRVDFIGYFDAFRTSTDGLPTHWLAMCFAVLVDPQQVKLNEPDILDEIGWFTLDDLPSPLHSQSHIFLEKHGDKLKECMGL